jgi:DNA gyrase subunit A
MFATSRGTVRRNKLSDFIQVNRGGKIAMKLDEGDHIVDVQICSEADDVLLTTGAGQCIRFPVTDVRVFKGRDSTGVRGISLAKGDLVISMGILHHAEFTAEERTAYLKKRRGGEAGADEAVIAMDAEAEDAVPAIDLDEAKTGAMRAVEQFVLTLSERGFGKRTSSYEYRITSRGGKGIVAMAVNERNGPLVASFPVGHEDQIMLITNGGQTIRVPVGDIRIAGRATQGVTVFKTDGERVVSVEHIEGEEAAEAETGGAETGEAEGGEAESGEE